MCYSIQHAYIQYISHISYISLTIYCNAVRPKRCELQRTDRRGGRWGEGERRGTEVPTGRMSNKQKLLKIIVAYLADSRGMPQTRRQRREAVQAGSAIAAYCQAHQRRPTNASHTLQMGHVACGRHRRKTHIIYLVLPPYQRSSTVRMSNIL